MLETLRALYTRELATLRREIEAYPTDASLWTLPAGLPNSGGTLTLHVCGNLQHFIGGVLGGSGYVRDRPAEFSRRNVPRSEMVREIDTTLEAVHRGLSALTPERLDDAYPEVMAGHRYQIGDFLTHLAVHLGFHLGQVDYHRRAVSGNASSARPMTMTELWSARDA